MSITQKEDKTLYIKYPAYVRCILYSKIPFGSCIKTIAFCKTYNNLEKYLALLNRLSFVMNSNFRT